MINFPSAKINFGLNIVSKRTDGYHNIESIFYPIGITDSLEITPSADGATHFDLYGAEIPGDKADNLIMKAWHIIQEEFNLPEITISLLKKIPMGGGIGGGSADAGFFINLADSYFNLNLHPGKKKEIALQLGSDCPFFIENQAAFVTGRGENLDIIPNFLQGYYLVLLYGGLHISTAEAYSGITPQHSGKPLLQAIQADSFTWKNDVLNDFEPVVFKKHPQLEILKQQLYDEGAVYASLTGTGSCLYGLFREKVVSGKLKDKVVWSGFL